MLKKKKTSQKIEEGSASGMVSQDAGALSKLRKKRTMKIVAIAVAIAFILGAIGGVVAGVLTMNNEGSFFYNVFKRGSLNTPQNLRIEDFDEESDFIMLIKWDKVMNATSYVLECKYDLYPDIIDTYEIQTKNGRYIERKRGELCYRVKASNLSGGGDFSEWKNFVVPPMQLELPEITMVQDGDDLIVSWTEVKYRYSEEYGTVYYECDEDGYFEDEEESVFPANVPYLTNVKQNKYSIENLKNRCDIFVVKVRPINYTFLGVESPIVGHTDIVIMNQPQKLYDIYVTPDGWAELSIDIKKIIINNEG